MLTYRIIELEAVRRAIEDGDPRVVYMKDSGNMGICLLNEWDDVATANPVGYVWPDGKIEYI